MTFRLFLPILFLLAFFCPRSLMAQERPIGYWRAHLPYNNAQGIATDGVSLYVISEKGFFTYNPLSGEQDKYSKVEGMHETGTTAIAYDKLTSTCIIAYQNSNIDLFRDNNFKVLPDIKNKTFSGSKSINHVFALNGFAYLSTGLGIVVIDLNKQEIKETYVFSKGGQTYAINAFTADSLYFYAATSKGLYRILRTSPTPQVFASWQIVDTMRTYRQLATVGGNTTYATAADTIFQLTSGGGILKVYYDSTATITRIDGGASTLYFGRFRPSNGSGRLLHLSLANVVSDSTQVAYPTGTVETADGKVWVADGYQGMGRREANTGISIINPSGPNSPDNTGLWVYNRELWIAHGGVNRRGSNAGLSHFQNEEWKTYHPYNYGPFQDSVYDFLDVLKDTRTGTLYAGTYNSGLFELKSDGTGRIIKQGDLDFCPGNVNGYSASSLTMDGSGNLFVTQLNANNEIAVLSSGGSWYHYPVASYGRLPAYRLGFGILIDDYNQKWFYSAINGGVIVYDDNGTPDNLSDDRQGQLTSAKGQGNLPSNTIRCMAKERDGAIWIGTDAGIGIVNCPTGAIDHTCDAELRIVQYDQFAGYLFSTESVRAIAVDGANRKWIGTLNGVWLLSSDASKILNRFTVDNSPLPSNIIQKIAIDGATGDVYIGTDQGLVSYRAEATDGGSVNGTVQTFPNPVPSGYTGQIAIRGLVTDADVRITDIAGQLIYRTKATGGQAVWNGLDYTGNRPQSGVCLIFITNKDGTQTSVGKLLFMH